MSLEIQCVPQLLILLDNVNSNDSLKTELWKTRSLSASTLDFYREYSFARDLLVVCQINFDG